MATKGQSAAVAAQYMLSGQQYQLASGQHPAGHSVPGHCFLAAILTSFSFMATKGQSAAVAAQYMLSGQQYKLTSGQHPAGHSVPGHCFLAAILISFSFMATKGQSAAVPVDFWAASSWAFSSLTLLLGSHLDKLLLHGNKRTVGSSGSAVHVIWAAVPVDF